MMVSLPALVPVGAAAGDLTVDIAGLRSQEGVVRVAVCPRAAFTGPDCPHAGVAPADMARVIVRNVPDGTYALQAFHDENDDGDLNRKGLRPAEGLAFSNDARMRLGPPRFRDAAVRVQGDGRLTLTMRYFQ
jgi:uncharacterized protein (DUF2141 family)